MVNDVWWNDIQGMVWWKKGSWGPCDIAIWINALWWMYMYVYNCDWKRIRDHGEKKGMWPGIPCIQGKIEWGKWLRSWRSFNNQTIKFLWNKILSFFLCKRNKWDLRNDYNSLGFHQGNKRGILNSCFASKLLLIPTRGIRDDFDNPKRFQTSLDFHKGNKR